MNTVLTHLDNGTAKYDFADNGKVVTIRAINGYTVAFEIMKKSVSLPNVNAYVDIFKAYAKPSNAKLDIFGFWHKFFDNLPNTTFYGIRSHNGFQFTLHGTLCINNIWYYFDISKSHNKLYPLI